MDSRLRGLERRCRTGDMDACHACLATYRRMGALSESIPPDILYIGTEVEILRQPALDFRSLLERSVSREDMFEPIYFNEDISISIQASRMHYCSPRETIDKWAYESWEIMFDQPVHRRMFWGPLDEEEREEVARLAQDPLAEVEDQDGDIEVVVQNPRFLEGGIYYGYPHQGSFSRYDQVAGWVPTEQLQDMFDFLRARFGLAG